MTGSNLRSLYRLDLGKRWRLGALSLILAGVLAAVASGWAKGQGYEADVEFAILVDFETGTVLYQRNADTPMPPASMAKLMTMFILFEALRDGRYTLDDEFVISENAWRKGGAPSGTSTMFAELGSSIAIRDLMRGVIVQSGNDASIAIAEGMAGSEETFAVQMNEAAERLGLEGTVFTNSTGLPDPEQRVTARDLATLAAAIIRQFPDFYRIYSERSFTWNGITQSNRNALLGMNIGADGMKTGFTEESGYGLIASATRGDRRLIAVINGAESAESRTAEAAALLEWGFNSFRRVSLFGDGDAIAEADVFGGTQGTVGLRLTEPLNLLVPEGDQLAITAEVTYDGPLVAPVEADEVVGTLRIFMGNDEIAVAPLVTVEPVGAGTLPQRARDALMDLLFGWQ